MPKRIKPLTEVLDGIDTGTEFNLEAGMDFDKDRYICKNKDSENHHKWMSHYASCDNFVGVGVRGGFQCWVCKHGSKVNFKARS